MNPDKKFQFCAICGRNHDPKYPCASVGGFDSAETMGDTKSKNKDAGSSFQALSKKTDKIMILIAVLLVLFILVGLYITRT